MKFTSRKQAATPRAVVAIAPDRCTPYLVQAVPAVEAALDVAEPGDVVEVPCPNLDERVELAGWCLRTGHRVAPFEHWRTERVLITRR